MFANIVGQIFFAKHVLLHICGKNDLNEELNIKLESDNSETLGGFLIDLLGEIPTEDETNRVIKFKNFEFTILSVKDRRIESIKMSILPEQEEDMEDEEQ